MDYLFLLIVYSIMVFGGLYLFFTGYRVIGIGIIIINLALMYMVSSHN